MARRPLAIITGCGFAANELSLRAHDARCKLGLLDGLQSLEEVREACRGCDRRAKLELHGSAEPPQEAPAVLDLAPRGGAATSGAVPDWLAELEAATAGVPDEEPVEAPVEAPVETPVEARGAAAAPPSLDDFLLIDEDDEVPGARGQVESEGPGPGEPQGSIGTGATGAVVTSIDLVPRAIEGEERGEAQPNETAAPLPAARKDARAAWDLWDTEEVQRELQPLPASDDLAKPDGDDDGEPVLLDLPMEGDAYVPGSPTHRIGRPDPRPPVDQLLRQLGSRGGPSLLGWSSLSVALRCLRLFYYRRILGLGSPTDVEQLDSKTGEVKVQPLALGSVLHAALELYCKGNLWDVHAGAALIQKVGEVYPVLGVEAKRLYNFYLRKHEATDAALYDVRATEIESRFYFQPRSCAGKRRRLCVTCRTDTVLREKRGDGGNLPPDAATDGVLLHDWKTAGRMDGNTVTPWPHDGQVLLNFLAYARGIYVFPTPIGTEMLSDKSGAERFGPPKKFLLTVIGKAQEMHAEKHLVRVPYTIDVDLVDEFEQYIGDFLYDQLGPRLYHRDVRLASTWPKSYLCRDSITGTPCRFLDLCESSGRAQGLYVVDESQRLDPASLEMPKQKRGRKSTKVSTEATDK